MKKSHSRPPIIPPSVNLVPTIPDLTELVGLFYAQGRDLGKFTPVAGESMPAPYRGLLDHEHHMTVTVEQFHGSHVDVEVLNVQHKENFYSRKILLRRQSDHEVVQFGIVRLDFDHFSPEVCSEIESRRIPLGRVLINHNVMRVIHLAQLWQIECGPDLAKMFGCEVGKVTFGRTAIIDADGSPSIELLEIVTPVGERH